MQIHAMYNVHHTKSKRHIRILPFHFDATVDATGPTGSNRTAMTDNRASSHPESPHFHLDSSHPCYKPMTHEGTTKHPTHPKDTGHLTISTLTINNYQWTNKSLYIPGAFLAIPYKCIQPPIQSMITT